MSMAMRVSQVASAIGAQWVGSDGEFSAVSTDSRKIVPGDLFIALRGETFDGYAFAADTLKAGAAAVMVNADSYAAHPERFQPQSALLLVDDTRLALGRLAAYWRNQFTLPVIGLTGSNGKTTVKEMLASILRVQTGDADAVLATQGNLNNDIGMPLTLLNLRAHHRYAVIEMGMNHTGEIDYLTRIARPDVALINNATSAHLAGLGSVEAVARAKGEIFAGLGEHGVAIINGDDAYAPLWRELAGKHRVLTFALDAEADVSACWDVTATGVQLEMTTPQGVCSVALQVPGAHNARNALAAAAAACALDIRLEAIVRGLESFGGVAGRLQRKAARQGAQLIDDTYNANPASMRAALGVLAQAPGRRIFVMGDMGELGDDAARFHAEIGAEAKRYGIQRLFALGALSRDTVQAFGEGAGHYDSVEMLCAELEQELQPGVTILVKGSRFMKMERVVVHCSEHKEETCCSH